MSLYDDPPRPSRHLTRLMLLGLGSLLAAAAASATLLILHLPPPGWYRLWVGVSAGMVFIGLIGAEVVDEFDRGTNEN